MQHNSIRLQLRVIVLLARQLPLRLGEVALLVADTEGCVNHLLPDVFEPVRAKGKARFPQALVRLAVDDFQHIGEKHLIRIVKSTAQLLLQCSAEPLAMERDLRLGRFVVREQPSEAQKAQINAILMNQGYQVIFVDNILLRDKVQIIDIRFLNNRLLLLNRAVPVDFSALGGGVFHDALLVVASGDEVLDDVDIGVQRRIRRCVPLLHKTAFAVLLVAVKRQRVEQQQQILAQQLIIILQRQRVAQRKGNCVVFAVKLQAYKGVGFPVGVDMASVLEQAAHSSSAGSWAGLSASASSAASAGSSSAALGCSAASSSIRFCISL